MKYTVGTLAATTLLILGVNSNKQKPLTPLEQAQVELDLAKARFSADSLDYENTKNNAVDYLRALEAYKQMKLINRNQMEISNKLPQNKVFPKDNSLQNIQQELDKEINNLQIQADKATGKRYIQSAVNLAKAEERIREIKFNEIMNR